MSQDPVKKGFWREHPQERPAGISPADVRTLLNMLTNAVKTAVVARAVGRVRAKEKERAKDAVVLGSLMVPRKRAIANFLLKCDELFLDRDSDLTK